MEERGAKRMSCCEDKEDRNYIKVTFKSYGKEYEIGSDSFSSADDMCEFMNAVLHFTGFDFLEVVRKEKQPDDNF
jgi:hypothetical protein